MKPTSRRHGTIRVLVCGNSRMGAELLADALARCKGLQVVGNVTDFDEALRVAARRNPTVVTVAGMMQNDPAKSLEVCRKLCAAYPGIAVVLLSDFPKPESVVDAVRSGATGLFCQGESITALAECIHCVHGGQIWARDRELRLAFEGLTRPKPPTVSTSQGAVSLTEREQEVVQCVAEGLSNREIASKLQLSAHTVKNYLFRVFEKLGLSSRVELVLYAFNRAGLDSPNDRRPVGFGSPSISGRSGPLQSELYRAASELGIAAAQFRLGESCRDGKGMSRNRGASYKWFLLAEASAAAVAELSREAASQLLVTMDPVEISEAVAEAEEWLKRHSANRKLLVPNQEAIVEAYRILSRLSGGARKFGGSGSRSSSPIPN